MEQSNNPIGSNIRKYRLKKGWTQEELAKKASEFAKVSRPHIASIESGRYDPSDEVLDGICRALEVTSFDLITGDPDVYEYELVRILIKKTEDNKIKWISSDEKLNEKYGLETDYDASIPKKLRTELFGTAPGEILFYTEHQNSKYALSEDHSHDYERMLWLYAEIGDRKIHIPSVSEEILFAYLDKLLDVIKNENTADIEDDILVALLQDLGTE